MFDFKKQLWPAQGTARVRSLDTSLTIFDPSACSTGRHQPQRNSKRWCWLHYAQLFHKIGSLGPAIQKGKSWSHFILENRRTILPKTVVATRFFEMLSWGGSSGLNWIHYEVPWLKFLTINWWQPSHKQAGAIADERMHSGHHWCLFR